MASALRHATTPARRNLLFLLLISLLSALFVFDPKLDPNGDNATYLLLGTAISNGSGYVDLNSLPHVAHCQYPPVYPLLIAGMQSISKGNLQHELVMVKALNVTLYLACIALFYLLCLRLLPDPRIAFAASLLVALNGHVLRFAVIEMSEIPHLLWVLAGLLCLTASATGTRRRKLVLFATALAMLSVSYYTRTAGISLAAAMVAYLVLERRWRDSVVCAVYSVAMAFPWWLWCRAHQSGGYVSQLLCLDPYNADAGRAGLGDLAVRVLKNVSRYISTEIPNGLVPTLEPLRLGGFASWCVGLALLGLVVYGVVRCGRRARLPMLYCLFTLGMLFLWPAVWNGVRFSFSLIPLLTVFACVGVLAGIGRVLALRRSLPRPHPALLLLLAAAHFGPIWDLHRMARMPYEPSFRSFLLAAQWASANTPRDAVFSCRKPTVFSYVAGRPATAYLFTAQHGKLWQDLCDHGVDYVVLDELGYSATPKYLWPALRQYRYAFQPVYQAPSSQTYVLAMANQGASAGRGMAVARSLSVQGLEYYLSGDDAEALSCYRQSEQFFQACRPVPLGELGRLHNNAANVFCRQMAYDSALVRIIKARDGLATETPPDAEALAQAYFNLAVVYDFAGRDSQALAAYQDAQVFTATHMGERHPRVARVLNNLGKLYQRHAQTHKAEKCYLDAIAICEQSPQETGDLLGLLRQNLAALDRR